MKSTVERVKEFHVAFKQDDMEKPQVPSCQPLFIGSMAGQMEGIAKVLLDTANAEKTAGLDPRCSMRLHLIQEELSELARAMESLDIVAALDALTDLQYVIDGTYVALGLIDVKEAAFDEVHRSNMSKLGEDGQPILAPGGRVQKGPNYFKPDLRAILDRSTKQAA